MIADDEVDLKAGSRPPVARGLPGGIVAVAGKFVHDISFEGLPEFRCAQSKLPLLKRRRYPDIEK